MLELNVNASSNIAKYRHILLFASIFCLLDFSFAKKQALNMPAIKPVSPEDWNALRAEITEAFSPGAPVQERDLFSGRSSQIASLEDAVNQRGRHAIVYGERGVGKTSLVNVLPLVMHRPNKELIYVRVNCDPTDTFVTLWKKVFKRMTYVVSTLEGSVTKKISEDFGAELSPDDVQLVLSVISQFDGLTFTIGDGQSGQDERRPGQQNGTGIATGAVLASGG